MLCEKKSSKCHCWDVLNKLKCIFIQINRYFILQKVINLYTLEKSKTLKFNLFFHLDKIGGGGMVKCETFGINNIINPMTTTFLSDQIEWLDNKNMKTKVQTSLPTPYVCQVYRNHMHIVYVCWMYMQHILINSKINVMSQVFIWPTLLNSPCS